MPRSRPVNSQTHARKCRWTRGVPQGESRVRGFCWRSARRFRYGEGRSGYCRWCTSVRHPTPCNVRSGETHLGMSGNMAWIVSTLRYIPSSAQHSTRFAKIRAHLLLCDVSRSEAENRGRRLCVIAGLLAYTVASSSVVVTIRDARTRCRPSEHNNYDSERYQNVDDLTHGGHVQQDGGFDGGCGERRLLPISFS